MLVGQGASRRFCAASASADAPTSVPTAHVSKATPGDHRGDLSLTGPIDRAAWGSKWPPSWRFHHSYRSVGLGRPRGAEVACQVAGEDPVEVQKSLEFGARPYGVLEVGESSDEAG
jgi:hypothetical protein